ncbi:hypothetical protein GTX14_08610, partial [Streptomyces sp. SID4944]|nr:hypothetical protein [Streptomyces sp. SID4944]
EAEGGGPKPPPAGIGPVPSGAGPALGIDVTVCWSWTAGGGGVAASFLPSSTPLSGGAHGSRGAARPGLLCVV